MQVRLSVQENTDCIYKYNLQIIFCRTALQAACGHIIYMDCFTSIVTWTSYHQEGRIYFAPTRYITNNVVLLPSVRRKSRAHVRLICLTNSSYFHLQKLKGFWRQHRGQRSQGCAASPTVHKDAVLLLGQITYLHRGTKTCRCCPGFQWSRHPTCASSRSSHSHREPPQKNQTSNTTLTIINPTQSFKTMSEKHL